MNCILLFIYLKIAVHGLKIMHPLQNLNCTRNCNEVLVSALPSIVIIMTKFLDSKGRAIHTWFVKPWCRGRNNHVKGITLQNVHLSTLTAAEVFLT